MEQTPRRRREWRGRLWCSIILALVALMAGCSDYSTQSYESQTATVTIELDRPSLLLQQSIGLIDLYVIDESKDSTLAYVVLADTGGIVTTRIDSLPAVRTLDFVMAAYPVETSSVPLYLAQRRVSLIPDQVNQITMTMQPIVPMIRVQPRFVSRMTGDVFSIDIRVDKVEDLYGLSFRVLYDALRLQVDSVRSIAADDAIFVAEPEDTLAGETGTWAVGVSATEQGVPLVDDDGGADLVRLYCRPAVAPPWEVTDSARVWLEVTGGTMVDSTDLVQGSVYTDEGVVEFMMSGV